MSTGEKVLIVVGPASWTLLLIALVVLVLAAAPVKWDRVTRAGWRNRPELASHRAVPWWLRWGARRGAPRPPKPPKLTPEPVSRPAPPSWTAADVNAVRWPANPARGSASVPFTSAWEELNVVDDVLRGRMRAAANTEDTGLIEPIRAEVVRW